MGILGNLFGGSSKTVEQYLSEGALIVDVRTPGEFQGGHVAGSKNYPLQSIGKNVSELKKLNKKLVLCCASGMRSGQATSILKGEGLDCVNGGGWMKVNGLV